jgi:putative peptide zinc metalloprotease protein
MQKVKRHRVAISGAALAAIVLIVLFLPLPHYVRCTFTVEPRDAAAIYAESQGIMLQPPLKPGTTVQANDTVLVKLESLALEAQVMELEGKLEQARTLLTSLRERRFSDPTADLQIASTQEILETTEEQLAEKQRELTRLTVVSPVSGIVLPAPFHPGGGKDGRLPTWSGSLLDDRNVNAVVNPGDQICFVGDPKKLQAVMVVDQGDFNLVRDKHDKTGGSPVALKLESYRVKTLYSTVDEKSMVEMKTTPPSLMAQAGGGVQTKMDASGNPIPMNTSYQTSASLDDPPHELKIGMRGKARIFVGYTPISLRVYRYVAKTFNFDL